MPPRPIRAWLSWSSGKDCAWALHRLRARQDVDGVEVVALLTTLNESAGRVAMHAVREELLEMQAAAVGLPLVKVLLPQPCSNAQYEAAMERAMERARGEKVEAVAFGDLFLEDVRRYREERMAGTGIEPLFPLWGSETGELAREMVASGLRARVTCVDPKQLDRSFAGRIFDDAFLDDLPDGVDPCGERGELHTFCYAGPMLAQAIAVEPGEIVERDGFVFADLRPGA